MSDEFDPFKPVTWGKKKDGNNFFEPVGPVATADNNSYWGYGSGKDETSWSNSGSGKRENNTWGWESGPESGKANGNSSFWGFSNDSGNKKDTLWSSCWSSSHNSSDALGFGSHSSLMSLKAREDGLKSSNDWATADTSWTFSNVNAALEVGAAISRIEDSRKSWAYSAPKSNSSWAWEPAGGCESKASSWAFQTSFGGNESKAAAPSWAFQTSLGGNEPKTTLASKSWGWDAPSDSGSPTNFFGPGKKFA